VGDESAAWAALRDAQQFAGEAEPAKALACCDRAIAALGSDPAPAVHAGRDADPGHGGFRPGTDLAALRGVSGPLMAHGQWEAAASAHSLIAAAR